MHYMPKKNLISRKKIAQHFEYHDESGGHMEVAWQRQLLPNKWHICYPPIQTRVRSNVVPEDSLSAQFAAFADSYHAGGVGHRAAHTKLAIA